MDNLFGALELDPSGALIAAAVFAAMFAVVCAIGFRLLRQPADRDRHERTRAADASHWTIQLSGEIPVSAETVRDIDPGGIFRPQDTPGDGLGLADSLDRARSGLVKVYRWSMIAAGAGGIAVGIALVLAHTPANMLGLPGAIALVLGSVALLKGLIPSRSITGWTESFALGPLLQKVHVHVKRSPTRMSLGEETTTRALELIRQGLPISEAARSVVPNYDRLDADVREALVSTLQELARRQATAKGSNRAGA